MGTTKTWFITGVSTGFGRELAFKALAAGDIVIGTFRSKEQLDAFQTTSPNAHGVILDVTDEHAIERVLADTLRVHHQIDVLVNNAGYGLEGAIEESTMVQARHQFEVNFFGALALIKAVLPGMRKRRAGHIINITSTGGLLAFPGIGLYNASKHALEGLTDALSQEVRHLGIHAIAIEPGPFRTDWAGRSMVRAESRINDYEQSAGTMRAALAQRNGKQPGDPERAADAILAVVGVEDPPRRLVLGAVGFRQVGENLASRQAELVRNVSVSLGADYPT